MDHMSACVLSLGVVNFIWRLDCTTRLQPVVSAQFIVRPKVLKRHRISEAKPVTSLPESCGGLCHERFHLPSLGMNDICSRLGSNIELYQSFLRRY